MRVLAVLLAAGLSAGLATAPLLGASGCGGARATTPQPTGGPDDVGEGSAAPPGPGEPGEEAGAPGAPLDDAECNQLADHLVDLSMAARRPPPPPPGGKPPAPGDSYTAEDAEAAKRELRQSLRPACAQLPRRDFRCAMAARTAAELRACEQ